MDLGVYIVGWWRGQAILESSGGGSLSGGFCAQVGGPLILEDTMFSLKSVLFGQLDNLVQFWSYVRYLKIHIKDFFETLQHKLVLQDRKDFMFSISSKIT